MPTTHRTRARGERRPGRGRPRDGDDDAFLGPSGFPLAFRGWDGLGVTAQVPAVVLRAGSLQDLRVGHRRDLALSIFGYEITPAYVGPDRWEVTERSFLEARGTVVPARPGAPSCAPPALEVVGRRWPLAAQEGARPGTRVDVVGALYVEACGHDPGLERVAHELRRTWVVRGFRRTHPGRRSRVTARDTLPAPSEVDDRTFYFLDLEPPSSGDRGVR